MMMGSWWLLWMVFLFVFLLPPLGYGWGYRGWGPPYPRYVQRRRAAAFAGGAGGGATASFNHHAWSWGGDYVWLMVTVGVFWAVIALLWR